MLWKTSTPAEEWDEHRQGHRTPLLPAGAWVQSWLILVSELLKNPNTFHLANLVHLVNRGMINMELN